MSRSSVAVVGGGLVGGMAALGLARLGFAVTLHDQRVPAVTRGRLGIDIRNFALSPASQAQLAASGVWYGLPAAPFRTMRVWEEWGLSELCFAAAEVSRDELGWVVESSPLLVAVWQTLEAAGVRLQVGEIERIEAADDGIWVGGERYDFVVGADGANSAVRRALGVPLMEHPTGQAALATVVRTERPHDHTAWQRFLHDGPLALLPSPDPHVCSVVWSQSPEQAAARQALDDADFCREIGRASEFRLGEVLAADARAVFPLTQQRVRSCAPQRRAVLIGDAMRVIHPLAGLGVNLGLEDVRELVKVAGRHGDLAAPDVWRRFARQREARSEIMIRLMASLRRAYGNSSPVLGWLRNVGVGAVDGQPWLKLPIMREALGLDSLAPAR